MGDCDCGLQTIAILGIIVLGVGALSLFALHLMQQRNYQVTTSFVRNTATQNIDSIKESVTYV